MAERTWTSEEAAELTGISFRQLDYWDHKGIVSPSIDRQPGSGSDRVRRYTAVDVVCLRLVAELRSYGMELASPVVAASLDAVRSERPEGLLDGVLIVLIAAAGATSPARVLGPLAAADALLEAAMAADSAFVLPLARFVDFGHPEG